MTLFFNVLTGNRFVLIHVSMICMCNKTKTKACLFQQNLLCLELLQKQSAKTIGNYCFSSVVYENVNIEVGTKNRVIFAY